MTWVTATHWTSGRNERCLAWPSVTSDATALVLPAAGGLHRLELMGLFSHPHWLAFLCGGLSSAGVSVVSGSATRTAPMRWEGHFVVDGSLDGLDPVALAGTRPSVRDATVPRLSSYQVVRRRDGQLDLTVGAPDALGFLGRLLSRVSLLTLVPSECHIATVDGAIADRFVLGGIGTGALSDDVTAALEDLLRALVA